MVRKSYVEDLAKFFNELSIFKLIAGKEMCHLIEFVGFTHNVVFNGFRFVGTILTKYYNEESLDQYLMPDKGLKATFTQFNNIVLQIAKGFFLNKIFKVSFLNKITKIIFKKGMKYLNNNLKIIHRNLKGTKVFLNENKQTKEIDTVLIGDFAHALHDDISSLSKNRDFVDIQLLKQAF